MSDAEQDEFAEALACPYCQVYFELGLRCFWCEPAAYADEADDAPS